jgi:hypothetical protein
VFEERFSAERMALSYCEVYSRIGAVQRARGRRVS